VQGGASKFLQKSERDCPEIPRLCADRDRSGAYFYRVSDDVDVLAVISEATSAQRLPPVGLEGSQAAWLRRIEVFIAVGVVQLDEWDDKADLLERHVPSSAQALDDLR